MRTRLFPSKGAFGLGGHCIRTTQKLSDQEGLWASPLIQWSAHTGSRVLHKVRWVRQPLPQAAGQVPVKECGAWAHWSSVLGMSPQSSSAQSRSGRRCVTFIYWCHNVFALPCSSEPAQGVGVAALEAVLEIFFFFLLVASRYLTQWHKRPITVSSPRRLILTQLGTTVSHVGCN